MSFPQLRRFKLLDCGSTKRDANLIDRARHDNLVSSIPAIEDAPKRGNNLKEIRYFVDARILTDNR
jgi:hypothetical protein